MATFTKRRIQRGVSRSSDATTAVKELHQALHQDGAELAVLFCSSRYDSDELATAIRGAFGDVPVVGCTTAGEIGPAGYVDGGVTGVSLPTTDFDAVTGVLPNLADFEPSQSVNFVTHLLAKLEGKSGTLRPDRCFALLLIDGLSMREEIVASTLSQSLGDIPLFGGSAGDDLQFHRTLVYGEGAFHENAAVLTIVQTSRPFHVFKAQHFIGSEKKMVVTGADPENRIVHEIDGEPAADAYARAVGVSPDELDSEVFASWPVVVKIGGDLYVRSIRQSNDDGSLTFFCAIDEGIVFTLAEGVQVRNHVEGLFRDIRGLIGAPELVIGCDCILRNLEFQRKNLREFVAGVLEENRLVGFSTYGEQFKGMHVNQTLTGVAIGAGNGEHGAGS